MHFGHFSISTFAKTSVFIVLYLRLRVSLTELGQKRLPGSGRLLPRFTYPHFHLVQVVQLLYCFSLFIRLGV
ncbi:hypothetical protein AFLA_000236 [Aspergillus flavus NRRL3357]|nr:hypothetical protein AFLA_000236 [Aspergillus flavus NRRL3357]